MYIYILYYYILCVLARGENSTARPTEHATPPALLPREGTLPILHTIDFRKIVLRANRTKPTQHNNLIHSDRTINKRVCQNVVLQSVGTCRQNFWCYYSVSIITENDSFFKFIFYFIRKIKKCFPQKLCKSEKKGYSYVIIYYCYREKRLSLFRNIDNIIMQLDEELYL